MEIKEIDMLKKITKKEYKEKLNNQMYFMIETIYNKNIYGVIDLLIEKSLDKTFKDTIKNNCTFYNGYNIKENTKNFLHSNGINGNIMQENKKGNFYSIIIDDILYLLHDYKDNTISIKAII